MKDHGLCPSEKAAQRRQPLAVHKSDTNRSGNFSHELPIIALERLPGFEMGYVTQVLDALTEPLLTTPLGQEIWVLFTGFSRYQHTQARPARKDSKESFHRAGQARGAPGSQL